MPEQVLDEVVGYMQQLRVKAGQLVHPNLQGEPAAIRICADYHEIKKLVAANTDLEAGAPLLRADDTVFLPIGSSEEFFTENAEASDEAGEAEPLLFSLRHATGRRSARSKHNSLDRCGVASGSEPLRSAPQHP